MASSLRALFIAFLPLALPVLALVLGRPRPLPRADFTFVLPKENATLDPAQASSVSDGWLMLAMFDPLLRFHESTLEPLPAGARAYERSSDGITYTFHLDEKARWSDGRSVVAKDYEYGLLRLLDPTVASPNGSLLAPIHNASAAIGGRVALTEVGIHATSDFELSITLERPCPWFPRLVCHFALMPIRADILAAHGERAFSPEHIVCNGAYQPTLKLIRDRLRLERNDFHPRAKETQFAIIDALAIDSKATALNMFLKGDVDWVNALPTLAVPRLRESRAPTLVFSKMLGTNFLRFAVTKTPWNDVRVRRAIDYALDRAALCRYVYRIGETPASSLVCPGIPGYIPPQESRDRVDTARQLLAEAGYPDGRGFPEFELLHAADEAARPVAEAIAARLKETLGISVRPVPQEFKVFIDSQKNLRYDVCLGNWIGDYPDPTTFLDIFRASSGNNRTGWKDAAYDAKLDLAANELDESQRERLLLAAETYLLESGPIAPIAWRGQANLVATDLEGFTGNVLDLHPLDRLKRRAP